VRRYLRGQEVPRYRREARATKLDSYKQYVGERVKAAAPEWIPAAVLFRELRALGYSGGLTTLKMYLATLKPAAEAAPLIRFETEPGRQLQADFATIRRGADRLSVFIATLGWSRAAYVEFVEDERLQTLLACHEHVFEYFGGRDSLAEHLLSPPHLEHCHHYRSFDLKDYGLSRFIEYRLGYFVVTHSSASTSSPCPMEV
jgi:transposase